MHGEVRRREQEKEREKEREKSRRRKRVEGGGSAWENVRVVTVRRLTMNSRYFLKTGLYSANRLTVPLYH